MSEVDRLVMWVHEMTEKYYGVDGERIFENAALMMYTGNSIGTCTSTIDQNNRMRTCLIITSIITIIAFRFHLISSK